MPVSYSLHCRSIPAYQIVAADCLTLLSCVYGCAAVDHVCLEFDRIPGQRSVLLCDMCACACCLAIGFTLMCT